MSVEPLTLSGRHVVLAPLGQQHCEALEVAVRDGELWRHWYTSAPEPEAMKAEIDRRLKLQEEGSMLPFAVLDAASRRPVGMTTYMAIDRKHFRVEIGSTWLARSVQRTALNTEAKLLLLTHAFETLGCIAVELRTHALNHQSRRAISGSAPSSTGSCAITSGRATGLCGTRSSIASSNRNGRPFAPTFNGRLDRGAGG